MKAKCKREGCYEPCDCTHGYCWQHCPTPSKHKIQNYSSRAYPRTAEPHVGVEIEVEFGNSNGVKRALPLKGHIDGSLNYGAEFKVLAPAKRIIKKACKILDELWIRRAVVSSRCGVHVHLDMRGVSHTRKEEISRWLYLTQEVWFACMPASRRGTHFVNRIPISLARNGIIPTDHHCWANFSSYKTLEIRLHGGTLNPHKLAGWLSCMLHMMAKCRNEFYIFPTGMDSDGMGPPSAENAFWELWDKAPVEATEYLRTRQKNDGVLTDYAYQPHEEIHS